MVKKKDGEYLRADEAEEGHFAEEAQGNLGVLPSDINMYRGGITESQLRRIGASKNRYGQFTDAKRAKAEGINPIRDLEILRDIPGYEKMARQRVKGEVLGGLEGEGTIEGYTQGKKMTKQTQRKKGTLDMKRDKVKKKKKGYVRKTCEGFLGLQNRKKYIDGVLQPPKRKK